MRLTGVEVLGILAKRLEDRAKALERTALPGYEHVIYELRNFAGMARRAQAYLAGENLPR